MMFLREYRDRSEWLADHLPWAVLVAPGVVLNKDGSFLRVLAFRGPDLESATEAELVALLRDQSLILARGQSLSMQRQQEICALLGPILLREGENGYMTNELGGPSASELTFHSDAAYTPHPFDALSLHALDVVDDASSTRFVSAQQGYDRLPERLRRRLESLAG